MLTFLSFLFHFLCPLLIPAFRDNVSRQIMHTFKRMHQVLYQGATQAKKDSKHTNNE